MVQDPEGLIGDFVRAAAEAGLNHPRSPIRHEAQRAPHRAHALSPGTCAVYVFSLSESHGRRCPAASAATCAQGVAPRRAQLCCGSPEPVRRTLFPGLARTDQEPR